jgi:hypothetical protein
MAIKPYRGALRRSLPDAPVPLGKSEGVEVIRSNGIFTQRHRYFHHPELRLLQKDKR